MRSLLAIAMLAGLTLLPAVGHAQEPPPPGGGSSYCERCTLGEYCTMVSGVGICYDDATQCSIFFGFDGWSSCEASPPYGPCTVQWACHADLTLNYVPPGIVSGSGGIRFASITPCPASQRAGAPVQIVSVDRRTAVYLAPGQEREGLAAWLATR